MILWFAIVFSYVSLTKIIKKAIKEYQYNKKKAQHRSKSRSETLRDFDEELLEQANEVRARLGLKPKSRLAKDSAPPKKEEEVKEEDEIQEIIEYKRPALAVMNREIIDVRTGRRLLTIADVLAII